MTEIIQFSIIFIVFAVIFWIVAVAVFSPKYRGEAREGRARNEKTTWEADEKERRLQNFLKDNPNMPRTEAYQKFRNRENETTDDEYAKAVSEMDAELFLSDLERFLHSQPSEACWDNGYVTRLITPDYVKEAVDQSDRADRIVMTVFKNPNSMDKKTWEPQLQKIEELKKKIANVSNPQNHCSEERKKERGVALALAKLFEFRHCLISPASDEATDFYNEYEDAKKQMQK